MQRNQYKGLIIIFILSFAQCQLQSNLSISLQYTQIQNSSSIPDSIGIYSHNQLNSTFAIDQNYFDCGNYNLFTLNLTANNSNYTWVFTNFNTDLLVSVFAGYNHPTITNVTCRLFWIVTVPSQLIIQASSEESCIAWQDNKLYNSNIIRSATSRTFKTISKYNGVWS